MTSRCLVIFAREPVPGQVKTRLIPLLGADGACDLYRRLLLGTLRDTDLPGLERTLYVAGHAEELSHYGLPLRRQRGDDLGERMARAFQEMHAAGHDRVLLVGSDCPVLDPEYLEEAFAVLESADFVLGPAEDGGYVLIGSAHPSVWRPNPLAGVPFGGPEALAATRGALAAHGRVCLLTARWDVDTEKDYHRLSTLGLPGFGATVPN